MGAIVSGERLARPTSARQGADAVERDRDRLLRPVSAPSSLVLAAERHVEVARRAEALHRVDDLQAERKGVDGGGKGNSKGGITLEQETLLELRIGEALVDQTLQEGRDLLHALPSPHARDLLQELEASETLLSGVIRAVRDRQVDFQASATVSTAAAHRPQTASSMATSVDTDVEQEHMHARFMRRCVLVFIVVSPPSTVSPPHIVCKSGTMCVRICL